MYTQFKSIKYVQMRILINLNKIKASIHIQFNQSFTCTCIKLKFLNIGVNNTCIQIKGIAKKNLHTNDMLITNAIK